MTGPEHQLKRIQDKFALVLKNYQGLQKENEKMKSDFQKLNERCDALGREAEKLKAQSEIMKYNTNDGMQEGEKKDLEKRLNQYVREINRCIALLND